MHSVSIFDISGTAGAPFPKIALPSSRTPVRSRLIRLTLTIEMIRPLNQWGTCRLNGTVPEMNEQLGPEGVSVSMFLRKVG